jgi:hypothetical protein
LYLFLTHVLIAGGFIGRLYLRGCPGYTRTSGTYSGEEESLLFDEPQRRSPKNCPTVRFCRKDAGIHIGILSLFLCIYKKEIVGTLKKIERILDFIEIRIVEFVQIYRYALMQPTGGSSEARRSLHFLFKGLAGRRPSPYERSKMAMDRCSHDKGPRPGSLRRRTVS